MPDRVLDWRLFRYAMTAAEHGSFRRVAAALNVQQSTVSRGIRNIEHRLGATLFERSHSGIRPTQAGDRFLKEASLGFDLLGTMPSEAEEEILDQRSDTRSGPLSWPRLPPSLPRPLD